MDQPSRAIRAEELGLIKDADARENYIHFLKLRKSLLDAVTVERFYLEAFRKGVMDIPPVFLDMAAHAITRSLLDGIADIYEIRAGEMLFRRQRVSTDGGQVLAADAETIQLFSDTGGFGRVGRLLAQQGTPLASVNMDVLSHENSQLYWLREDRYAYLLDLTRGRAGEQALARLLSRWVKHFLGLEVVLESLGKVEDEAWRWHTGLDVESTAILNDLYEGREVDAERQQRLILLYRLTFADAREMRQDVAGKPIYVGIAISQDNVLKLKPQNLLLNLPLAKNG